MASKQRSNVQPMQTMELKLIAMTALHRDMKENRWDRWRVSGLASQAFKRQR